MRWYFLNATPRFSICSALSQCTTGMAILRDIVRGERDPDVLARHKHARIRASHPKIARSLEGTWREELLVVVGQNLELYDTYQEKIQLCDRRIGGAPAAL